MTDTLVARWDCCWCACSLNWSDCSHSLDSPSQPLSRANSSPPDCAHHLASPNSRTHARTAQEGQGQHSQGRQT